MKIRVGFVSNSSSCNFIFTDSDGLTLEEIKKKYPLKKHVPVYVKNFVWSVIKENGFKYFDHVVDEGLFEVIERIRDKDTSDSMRESFKLGDTYSCDMYYDYDIDDNDSDTELSDTDKAILYLRNHEDPSNSNNLMVYCIG